VTREARKRGRRSPRQRLLLAFSCAVVVGLLATAGGLSYVYSKYSRLPRVQLGSVLTETSGTSEPRNFLLVGVDSAANLAADDPARAGRGDVGGLRSDTIMILRLDPGSERASLLSLPRDLWVPMASGGSQRINSAIQSGGPSELIDTIEEYLGIPIHHYIQVDFAGFQELVEVVDGVDVYFAHPARDSRSGLDIQETGCLTLDGQQALSYVRSRHFQVYEDGRWRSDGSADLGRISRQQDFIVRALGRAVDQGVRNPVTLDRLVNAGLDTVTVDDLLTADDFIDLARAFRGFDPGSLDLYSLPVVSGSVGGASILRLVDERAQPTLDRFRGTDTSDLRPGDVRVRVLNGSGITGQAGQTGDALTAAGFGGAGTGEAERFDITQTLVRYTAGGEAKADLVARYLDPSPRLELVEGPLEADVVVVTGSRHAGVRTTPRAPGPSTTSTTTETTVTTASTAPEATPSSSSTTSTTVVGFVPEVPQGVDC
jgi:polyisoprenyl-teichoic acid--peptidoglycan teichoic acid transferase